MINSKEELKEEIIMLNSSLDMLRSEYKKLNDKYKKTSKESSCTLEDAIKKIYSILKDK